MPHLLGFCWSLGPHLRPSRLLRLMLLRRLFGELGIDEGGGEEAEATTTVHSQGEQGVQFVNADLPAE